MRRLALQLGREGCGLRWAAPAVAFLSSGLRGILYLATLLLLKFRGKAGGRSLCSRGTEGTEAWRMLCAASSRAGGTKSVHASLAMKQSCIMIVSGRLENRGKS